MILKLNVLITQVRLNVRVNWDTLGPGRHVSTKTNVVWVCIIALLQLRVSIRQDLSPVHAIQAGMDLELLATLSTNAPQTCTIVTLPMRFAWM